VKGQFGNGLSYSVQQMISCVVLKTDNDACSGTTVDIAWNKLSQINKNDPGY
jgi:hypothetical protein